MKPFTIHTTHKKLMKLMSGSLSDDTEEGRAFTKWLFLRVREPTDEDPNDVGSAWAEAIYRKSGMRPNRLTTLKDGTPNENGDFFNMRNTYVITFATDEEAALFKLKYL